MAILEDRQSSDRAAEIRQAQKIKSGLNPELKASIQMLSLSIRQQPISEENLDTLIEMKLAQKKFGRPYLTSLGRIVSLI